MSDKSDKPVIKDKDKGKSKNLSLMEKLMVTATKDDDFCFNYGSDSDHNFLIPKYHFRTGIEVLDTILGNGGLASSKITELYGPNKSGKSELAQVIAATFLNDFQDGIVMYFDQETALDDKKLMARPIYKCGRMILRKGKNLESCFNAMIKAAETLVADKVERPILFIFDSVAATGTKEEMENEVGKIIMAGQARVLSVGLRKIRGILLQTNAHLICVNQIRQKPGQMFGSAESACGEALKFYSDYRIQCVNIGGYWLSGGKSGKGSSDGYVIQYRTMKNKRATPNRKVEVPLMFSANGGMSSGLSDPWAIYMALSQYKIIVARGGILHSKHFEQPFKKSDWLGMYRDSLVPGSTKIVPDSSIARAIEELRGKVMDPSSVEVSDEADDDDDDITTD